MVRRRRFRRLVGVVVAPMALAGLATPAHSATAMDPPDGAYPYQRWVEQARVPTPDVVLRLIEEPCPPELAEFARPLGQPAVPQDHRRRPPLAHQAR